VRAKTNGAGFRKDQSQPFYGGRFWPKAAARAKPGRISIPLSLGVRCRPKADANDREIKSEATPFQLDLASLGKTDKASHQ